MYQKFILICLPFGFSEWYLIGKLKKKVFVGFLMGLLTMTQKIDVTSHYNCGEETSSWMKNWFLLVLWQWIVWIMRFGMICGILGVLFVDIDLGTSKFMPRHLRIIQQAPTRTSKGETLNSLESLQKILKMLREFIQNSRVLNQLRAVFQISKLLNFSLLNFWTFQGFPPHPLSKKPINFPENSNNFFWLFMLLPQSTLKDPEKCVVYCIEAHFCIHFYCCCNW